MKRTLGLLLVVALLVGLLSGCGGSSGKRSEITLNPADYETDEKMILVADMPPSPFDEDAVKLYKDLGFTHWLLTEDHTPMVHNGTLHNDYKSAIEYLSQQGFEVWIRNMQNDPE